MKLSVLILVTILLTACQTGNISPTPTASTVVFVTPSNARQSLPPSVLITLTPLPVQVWGMTRSAMLAPYLTPHHTPIVFKTPLPTLVDTLSNTTVTRVVEITGASTSISTSTPPATISSTPAATALSTTSACLSAYPDFCIPPGPHISCADLGQNNFTVLAPDPENYDRDGDGLGCEG
jgi:hypothetical protein